MIAVSLTRVSQFAAALRSGADLVELRTDYFSEAQLKQLIAKSRLPIIYTVKRATKYIPTVAYIDFDYRQAKSIPGTKVIASFHDYKTTPSYVVLEKLVIKLLQKKFIPKIATQVNSVDDLYILARLQKKFGKNVIVVGMGELGMMTRVYNKSLLTYACVSTKQATAPGQLTVQQLQTTRIFGLVGDDIQKSLSPKLHNRYSYHYQLWQTTDLKKFMFVFTYFQLPGASVTKPFKQDVMKYCDQLDTHARKIGAMNTLVRRGNKVIGYNTDWIGVDKSIGKYFSGKRVSILGQGGAAKSIAYAAELRHAKKIVLLSHHQLPTTNYLYDVLVNATPVRDRLLVPADSLSGKVVMDCNYGPPTQLVRTAKRQRAEVVFDGFPMLQAQAIAQSKLWQA